jgi:hypothetical protein
MDNLIAKDITCGDDLKALGHQIAKDMTTEWNLTVVALSLRRLRKYIDMMEREGSLDRHNVRYIKETVDGLLGGECAAVLAEFDAKHPQKPEV